MNKNNSLSFPRQDGKSTKTMQLLFNKYCNSQTTITVEQAIDFIENKLEIKLLNYQKKFLRETWNNIKIDSIDKKEKNNEQRIYNKYKTL